MPSIATVFRHPLGNGILTETRYDLDGYYTAQGHSDYLSGYGYHLGEDWNGDSGGNTDLGDSVFASANGKVVFAGNGGTGWGKVVIIQHRMSDGSIVSTLYGHLDSIAVSMNDDVTIGENIGEIGTGGGIYSAHLHFALYLGALTSPGPGYTSYPDPDKYNSGYIDPTWFINNHRAATDNAGNTRATATAMAVGITKSGSVGIGTDTNDFFKFVATGTGRVTATLNGLSQDIDLHALNSAGSNLATSSNGGTTSDSISFNVVAGQTYYLHVDPYGTAKSNYNLITSFSAVDNAGNTRATATAMTVGITKSGSVGIGTDTNDFFKFVATGTGRVTATLNGLSQDIDLHALNSAGSNLATSSNGGTTSDSVSFNVVAGQTYYLHVDPYGTAKSNYNLITSFAATDNAGNTRATAAAMTVGSTKSGSVGIGTDTNDFFKFVATGTGRVTATLNGLSQDIDLHALNSAGSNIATSSNGGTTSDSVSFNVVAGQTYYLHVDPYGTSKSNYNLITSFTATGDAGNTRSTATAMTVGTSKSGSVGFGADTDDYFKFVMPKSGTVVASLKGLSADIDLYAYNSLGQTLDSSSYSGSANEFISFFALAGQTIYLHVNPFLSAASNYTMDTSII